MTALFPQRHPIDIDLVPGVWPPSLFGKNLAALISNFALEGKTVVDIGCGSGLQAITAAKGGANVVASDSTKTNARQVARSIGVNAKTVWHIAKAEGIPLKRGRPAIARQVRPAGTQGPTG